MGAEGLRRCAGVRVSEVNRGSGGGCVTDYSGSVGEETERRGPAAHSSRSAVSASALLKPCDEGACQLLSSPLNCIRSPPDPKYNRNRSAFTAQRGTREKKKGATFPASLLKHMYLYINIFIYGTSMKLAIHAGLNTLKLFPVYDTLPTV